MPGWGELLFESLSHDRHIHSECGNHFWTCNLSNECPDSHHVRLVVLFIFCSPHLDPHFGALFNHPGQPDTLGQVLPDGGTNLRDGEATLRGGGDFEVSGEGVAMPRGQRGGCGHCVQGGVLGERCWGRGSHWDRYGSNRCRYSLSGGGVGRQSGRGGHGWNG